MSTEGRVAGKKGLAASIFLTLYSTYALNTLRSTWKDSQKRRTLLSLSFQKQQISWKLDSTLGAYNLMTGLSLMMGSDV